MWYKGMGGTPSLAIMWFINQGWQYLKESGMVMVWSQTTQIQIQVLYLLAVWSWTSFLSLCA